MEGSAGGHRSLKNFSDTRKVFRMHRIACSPILHLFKRSAKILDDLTIDGIELTARSHDRNEPVYPVNCRTCISLAIPQYLLGALALGQVEHESNTLTAAFLEGRPAGQHGNTAAVFP